MEAEIEEQFDKDFEKEDLDRTERERELEKLLKMEKHERAGYCLELKMLRHLNQGFPDRQLQYKPGLTFHQVLESKDAVARKTFDAFYVDTALRDHLDKLVAPLTTRFNDMHKAVAKLQATGAADHHALQELVLAAGKLGQVSTALEAVERQASARDQAMQEHTAEVETTIAHFGRDWMLFCLRSRESRRMSKISMIKLPHQMEGWSSFGSTWRS